MSAQREIDCILLERHGAVTGGDPHEAGWPAPRAAPARSGPLFSGLFAVASIPDERADAHFRSQHTFVTNEEGQLAIDFVGRFERLADDFRLAAQRIGLPPIELPRVQVARHPVDHAAFYTAETRAIVADRYGQDVEMFGYAFDAG
jgi:hypothetical protein